MRFEKAAGGPGLGDATGRRDEQGAPGQLLQRVAGEGEMAGPCGLANWGDLQAIGLALLKQEFGCRNI